MKINKQLSLYYSGLTLVSVGVGLLAGPSAELILFGCGVLIHAILSIIESIP